MSAVRRFVQAAVLGDADASEQACTLAEQIGGLLAEMNIVLINGGRAGAMEAACRGAVLHGGLTVGILPSEHLSDANDFCRIVVPTGLGHARNVLTVLSADCAIVVGASAGTLSEACFAWIHGRPIFLMEGFCGKWESVLGSEIDARATSRVIRCASIEQLRQALLSSFSQD